MVCFSFHSTSFSYYFTSFFRDNILKSIGLFTFLVIDGLPWINGLVWCCTDTAKEVHSGRIEHLLRLNHRILFESKWLKLVVQCLIVFKTHSLKFHKPCVYRFMTFFFQNTTMKSCIPIANNCFNSNFYCFISRCSFTLFTVNLRSYFDTALKERILSIKCICLFVIIVYTIQTENRRYMYNIVIERKTTKRLL